MTSLAAIHTVKKALGLDDDVYRALLERVTGKTSAKDLTDAERRRVIEEMRRQGFKGASKGARKPLEGKYAKKLQALWIAGWNLGLVRDRDDKALLAFVKRQTGIDHTRFLRDADDAVKAIEALKSWLSRAGVIFGWTMGYEWRKHDIAKIVDAQWQKLHGVPGHQDRNGFTRIVWEMASSPEYAEGTLADGLKPADWRIVSNMLGEQIRAVARKQSDYE